MSGQNKFASRMRMTGASDSLKKSIREIEDFLEGNGFKPPEGPLRETYHEALGQFAERWYRRGFNRGHRLSHEQYEANGKVPKRLKVDVKRALLGEKKRRMKLRSTIKK